MGSMFSGMMRKVLGTLGLVVLASWMAGCASDKGGGAAAAAGGGATPRPVPFVDELRIGDLVKVVFSGNPTPPMDQEERIKEDGTINLQFVGSVQAAGKTAGQLQREVQDAFVPKLYRRLTVTVLTENRVFFVDGEVRQPGRLVYTGELTVLKAVASAGGFTDFAARNRIELVRTTGEKFIINARKAKDQPRLDLPVIPGDRIFVPRRSPFGK